MNADEKFHNRITGQVIGCAFTVANPLGIGFLEKVYENALAHELRKAGLQVRCAAVRGRGEGHCSQARNAAASTQPDKR